MKKLLALVFSVAMCLCALCFGAAADGVPEQISGVYQIGTAEELYWFAGLVNGDESIIGDVQ